MATQADTALINGNVLTMNPSHPRAEAVAVKGERIIKVGTSGDIAKLIGESTKVIQLKGKTVVPGFIDTHIHVADFGRLLTWIDLSNVASIKEVQNLLSHRIEKTPKEKWVVGRGWDQNRFAEKRLPTRFDLDVVSPENPVVFYHQSGQVCVVNSKALELARITKQTTVPLDGAIDEDSETGELTGVLRDAATNLVWTLIPEPTEDELAEAAGVACEKIVEAGITSVHWIVLSAVELSIIKKLREADRLPLRVYVVVPANLLDSVVDLGSDDIVKIGGVEIAADGYLASRTAALLQPYSDAPETSGALSCSQEEMNAAAAAIVKAGFQLVIHAVGDRAVDAALIAIETIRQDARTRIEQAALLNEKLIDRMRKQNVIVSVQPRVVNSEFSVWSATEHLGLERAKWLYPLKTLLKAGVRVIGGSDCPMEPLSALLGIQTAVAREFYPEERVTVDEALHMYTINAAYSSSEENSKGSIETGKLADMTVLSHDPLTVPPNDIKDILVEMTIVGGRVAYSKH